MIWGTLLNLSTDIAIGHVRTRFGPQRGLGLASRPSVKVDKEGG